jgi:hypothetical protein
LWLAYVLDTSLRHVGRVGTPQNWEMLDAKSGQERRRRRRRYALDDLELIKGESFIRFLTICSQIQFST